MDRTMRRYINIIALLAIIILSGCKREDDLIPVAKISFKDSYTAEFTSVTINCDVKSNVTIETLHVEYSVSEDMSESQQIEMSVTKDNTYSATIPNLSIQTEYYYRFVVGNKVSEFFDDQKRTFKTLDYIAPVVHTEDASSISGTKATLKGVVEFACEKPILEQGFMVGTQEDNLETYKVDGTDFTFNIENLNYKTTYYCRAYAKNDVGIGLGEIKTFQTCSAVSFNEIKLSSITANSAMIEAGVADNGGIEVDLQGIRYCVKGNDEVTFVETTASTTLNNLKHDTTYEVWGYAKTFEGEFEGDRVEFNTMDGKVLITTSSPSNVTTSSATLMGSITSDGGSKIIERGFCYSTKENPTTSDIKIKVLGETGDLEAELKNLPQNVKYYVKAYAINGIDTFYGEGISFTTLYDSATFGTITSSDITASSVSLKCSITSNGGSTITKCGFCYSTYKNPTIDDQIAVVSDSKTNLNATIKGLMSGVTYYVRAFATNANSTFYSDEISFITSEGIIQFTDPSTENIAAASVIVSSNILTAGGGTITERGFCYSIAKNPTTENNTVKSSGTLGEYSATITNLQNKTIYYIRAYAINESGTYYSKEITVKTLDGVASVITSDATNIKAQSATLNGNITSDGGSNITERGFCYSTSENPTVDDTKIKIDGTIGDISHSLTGLNHATKYYVRSYAKNNYGTHYGNQISFTTSSGVVDFNDVSTTSITVGTAQLSTQITFDGNSTITKRGFCYGTSPNPTTSDNIITVTGTTGDLTGKITGLSNGVRYYVRAFATNAIGTHYSEQTSFTTLSGLADVTTSAVTDIMAESVTFNGSIPSANGGTITSRGFCYSTSENPTINNNKATVTGATGQMTKSVANLEENTKYYVRAFATTSFGTTYGQQITFTTKDGIVNFTSINSSEILATSVNVSSSISTDGGSAIIEKGLCYSTSNCPTTADQKQTTTGSTYNYSSTITGLNCSTTYYIRAYAINNVGTYYSDEISITTDTGIATLNGFALSNVRQTQVDAYCNVTGDGGANILRRGFCYSTETNPSINSEIVTINGSIGDMACTIESLISDQDYFIKAFVETEHVVTYSDEISIHTIEGLATITDASIISVSETSATLGADLISMGGATVNTLGYCYTTHANPTISDNIITVSAQLGSYTVELTELEQHTTYYARPYGITEYGVRYGEEISFTTKYYPITFGEISVIEYPQTARITCEIQSDGGNEILEQGICYSTNDTPSINHNKIENISDNTVLIGSLNSEQKYYARRYATNRIGTFYSDVVEFQTVTVPDGAIPGLFSISATEMVFFSKGNLILDGESFKFADNQYDYLGSYTYANFAELKESRDFFHPNDYTAITGATISNSSTSGWDLMTSDEWNYIIKERNIEAYHVYIKIEENIFGTLILPDGWISPENVDLQSESQQPLTIDDFKTLEAAGAVFIPSTGLGKFFEYQSNNYKHTVYDYGAGGSQYFVKDHNYYTTTPQGVPDGISSAKVYLVWDKYAITRSIDYRKAGTSAKTGANSYISSVRLIQKHK